MVCMLSVLRSTEKSSVGAASQVLLKLDSRMANSLDLSREHRALKPSYSPFLDSTLMLVVIHCMISNLRRI